MPNFLSTQVTKLGNRPIDKLTVQEVGGRMRAIPFDFTAPVGDLAIADTIELCKVPAGARILGGKFVHSALGAARTITLGDGTTADKYATAIDVSAAGESDFAHTIAFKQNEVLAAELTLTATLAGGTMPAADVFQGFVTVQLAD